MAIEGLQLGVKERMGIKTKNRKKGELRLEVLRTVL